MSKFIKHCQLESIQVYPDRGLGRVPFRAESYADNFQCEKCEEWYDRQIESPIEDLCIHCYDLERCEECGNHPSEGSCVHCNKN